MVQDVDLVLREDADSLASAASIQSNAGPREESFNLKAPCPGEFPVLQVAQYHIKVVKNFIFLN